MFERKVRRQTRCHRLSSANSDFSDSSPLKPKLIMNPDSSSRRVCRAALVTNHSTLLATSSTHPEKAFTRLELLAALAALVLIAVVAIPAFAQGKPRSQQAICSNNLRAVGQAVLLFNAENGEKDPWGMPGAGYRNPLGNNAWYHASVLSNNLVHPKVLACPSDSLVRPAIDFSLSPDGGFPQPNYRNAAVSYFWGLDSHSSTPDSVLSGDRNIRYDSLGSSCSTGIAPTAAIFLSQNSPTGWREGLHGPSGNLLLHDGRVEQTSHHTVNRFFRYGIDDNGSVHLLLPRP